MQSTAGLVSKWLMLLKIPCSKKYVKKEINSHPDFPSLLSITDTLESLGVEHFALEIGKEELPQIPVPFLAHVQVGPGDFKLIEDVRTIEQVYPNFYKVWKGVVLAAEKPEKPVRNKKQDEQLAKERKIRTGIYAAMAGVLIVTLLTVITHFSFINLLLLLLSFAGTGVALLIIQHELGIESPIADKLCKAGTQTDCDKVLYSNGSGIFAWLKLSDAGIIYFSGITISLLLAFITGTTGVIVPLFSIPALLSLVFTGFSIYYQWKVVKKWCTLCLITIGVLWAQAALLLPSLSNLAAIDFTNSILLLPVFVFIVCAALWLLLINPTLFALKESEENENYLLRFKRNPSIFTDKLQKQRFIASDAWEDDLQLGNAGAALQITVACNPYCNPCAKAHITLHEIMEEHGREMGLTIRFMLRANEPDNKGLKALTYLLQLITASTREMGAIDRAAFTRKILHDWFSMMDYEKFSQLYPLTSAINVEKLVQKHEKWCAQSKINVTPTIIINNHTLPESYRINEIPGLINGLIVLNTANAEKSGVVATQQTW